MYWIVIGLLVGVVKSKDISKGENTELLMTISLAVAGAVLGGWIANLFTVELYTIFRAYKLIMPVSGALLILFIFHKLPP